MASGIALISGPQDPSQLDALLNQTIQAINGYLLGTSAQAVQVSAASTGTAISASAGQVTVNTTVRAAGTTGRYTIAAPIIGQQIKITSLSTSKASVTGLFARSKTKLTFSTTAALATAKLPSVILTALSTSAWGVSAGYGTVLMTS